MAASATNCASALGAPCAHRPANGTRGRTCRVQHNTMDRGNDPPYFAWVNQNITAAAMLLRGLSEPNDPHEQAIHRNLRALVETTAVHQAESSVSRHRLTASLRTRGMETQQTSRSTRSSLQPPSVAQEATSAPCLDLTTAPHRLPVHERLGPNRDARSSDRSPSPDSPGPRTFVQRL